MSWSSFLKFIVGLMLSIALIIGGGFALAQYFVAKLTAPPPKPIYPNDKSVGKASSPASTPRNSPTTATQAKATPSSSPTPSPLPSGSYRAKITQPIGLILRDGPGRDANRVGGIDFNERVIVLEDSSDKQWQRIRSENSDREGWVKAGNTERIN